MPFFHHVPPVHRLWLFRPPYDRLTAINVGWDPGRFVRGLAVVWHLQDTPQQLVEFDWLYDRPPEVGLILILPEADSIPAVSTAVQHIDLLRPNAVLPTGGTNKPRYYKDLMTVRAERLPGVVTQHLNWRGYLGSSNIRFAIRKILELAPEIHSISQLANRLRIPRRTLGRRFESAEIPPPSSWLQLARLLRVCVKLQATSDSIFQIATRAGYPDGFTLSNQMKRLIGCRPSDMRQLRGWEWIVEAWVRNQIAGGQMKTLDVDPRSNGYETEHAIPRLRASS
jgi:AraC-like DNA-binding protein